MGLMYPPVSAAALYGRLAVLDRPDLLAKVGELRERVASYLRGVSNTFGHCTSHAVDHSDQIVRELSNMLYTDPDDEASITVKLNATETYMLLLAAYLHDVGMVVTDAEKFRVLDSAAWTTFTSTNSEIASDVQRLQNALSAGATELTGPQELFVAAL